MSQDEEVREAMNELNEFDRIHGNVKRRIGYPKVTLQKDLLAVNGKEE